MFELWSSAIITSMRFQFTIFFLFSLVVKSHYLTGIFQIIDFKILESTELKQQSNCWISLKSLLFQWLPEEDLRITLEPRGEKSQVQTVWLHVDDWLKSVRNDDLKAPAPNRSSTVGNENSAACCFCHLLLLLQSRKKGAEFSSHSFFLFILFPVALILCAPSGARFNRRPAPNHRSKPSNNNHRRITNCVCWRKGA